MALGLEGFVLVPFLVQTAGFVFLLAGNFVYNELIEIPIMGLNKNLRKYEGQTAKKDKTRFEDEDDGFAKEIRD